MDEARRYHFPFHAYYPSQPVSAQGPPDTVEHFDSNDVERQHPSTFGTPRKSFSPPPPPPGDLYEANLQDDRRVSYSVDPRRSFSPSAAASDGTNTYMEKTERQPSQATGDQLGNAGLQSVWPEEAEKEVYRVAGYPSGTPSGQSATSHPPDTSHEKKRICGLPAKWFLVIAILVACIIIGLAVGLGVGLGEHHS